MAEKENVIARKQHQGPAGITFPVEVYRPDRSVTAETSKDLDGLLRAGYSLQGPAKKPGRKPKKSADE